MATVKTKDVMGTKVFIKKPCGVHSWEVDGREYQWDKSGWCYVIEAEQPRRLLFAAKLEGAVGYTMGYSDGTNAATRSNLAKLEEQQS